MGYEKAYKEALERAKSFQEKYGGDYAGYIFPELRESEDEKIRKFLIDYFTSYKIGNVATKLNGYRIDDILAYLEKQKEQKPAEWSNKDEEMMTEIIEFLEYAYPYDNEFRIAWLKSLRSRPKSSDNWKPSEEQIYSLGTVVKGAGENSVGSVAYNLKELYEQLKRLKEDEQ